MNCVAAHSVHRSSSREYSIEEVYYEKESKMESKKSSRVRTKEAEFNSDSEEEIHAPALSVLTTRVETAMGSATYHIPRACSVAADNKPHKVHQIKSKQISFFGIPAIRSLFLN